MSLGNPNLEIVNSVESAEKFMSWLGERRTVLGFDTETSGLDPNIDVLRLVQFGDLGTGWAIPWNQWGGVALEAISKYTDKPMVGHNSKFDVRFIEHHGNIRMPRENIHDTRLMCHLINPAGSTALKSNASRLVDSTAAYASKQLDAVMSEQHWTWASVPVDFQLYWCYGALDTVLTAHLFDKLHPIVETTYKAVYDLEQAVQWVLTDMEARGSRIDLTYTREKSSQLASFADSVADWCKVTYGISPGSNKQVTEQLLELGVDLGRRTATGGYSFDESTIEEILGCEFEDADPTTFGAGQMLAYQVLARRKSEKIRSTYLDPFLDYADADGFVHPRMNQVGARTGRMSMEHPALQTLPRGRVVRDCFIPRDGNGLISADFDGIEMRCLAHYAQDKNLIDAINSGDIHLATARRVYGDDTIEKSDVRRQIAKSVGFAKIYGAGPEKIAWTAGIPLDNAKAFLTQYDAMFPGVRVFQSTVNKVVKMRKETEGIAYVNTPIGRLEIAPDDRDYALVNALIQGLAADIFKEALVRLDNSEVGEFLTLPVHDEVIIDAPLENIEEIKRITVKVMSDDRWAVPLTVSADGPLDRWGAKYV
jgi:DNA polymerase-1